LKEPVGFDLGDFCNGGGGIYGVNYFAKGYHTYFKGSLSLHPPFKSKKKNELQREINYNI